MAKYKVHFSGFAYVEADNEVAAAEDYDLESIYEEKQVDAVEEADEFSVRLN